MGFWSKALVSSPFNSCSLFSFTTSPPLIPFLRAERLGISARMKSTHCCLYHSPAKKKKEQIHICRAAEYKFPDPIPEFADAETEKFETHLRNKLTKKEICGDSIDEIVGICTEIFSKFLHAEYGGPGTLLVIPFIDMADTINERGLPGGPQAARIAVKWAQDHVDKDWKEWSGGDSN